MNRYKKIFILLLLLNLVFWSLIKAENTLILEIELIGNYNIDEQLIKSLFTFEVGQNLKVEDVSKTINNLYQLGVFEDVLIEKQDFQQGILITVKVKEFPIVNSVTFKGNKKIKSDNIQTNVNLKKGSYWSPFLQREVINNISEEYKKKGYHLAVAEFEITDLEDNKVDILVNVSEGSKVTIKKIKIFGNKDIPSKKITGIMKTKKASLLRSGKFEKEKFDEDLKKAILQDRNHPSLVIWGLLNEEVNVPIFHHAVSALSLVRSLDDTRLVILNSGRLDGYTREGQGSRSPGPATWRAPGLRRPDLPAWDPRRGLAHPQSWPQPARA